MALNTIDGANNSQDIRAERIAAGTIGNDHVVHKGLGGKKVNAVIDDSDPAITYGLYAGFGSIATFDASGTTDFVSGGTKTVIGGLASPGTPGAAAAFTFTGTSIAVLGGTNPQSGNMRVYIDGVETKGRVPVFAGIKLGSFATPAISATTTTIPAVANSAFPATGELFLNGERITYTSKDSLGFYGCTRGANGTTASPHNASETIYLWDSAIGLYSATDWATKQILYYNPLLQPGSHRILIVAETNPTSTFARIFFDGFIIGSLLGASSIFTQLATVTIPTLTTDANGHVDIGSMASINNDSSRLAFLGMSQDNTETSSTTALGRLGLYYNPDGTPHYYLHNGPPSATFTLKLTFAFIGETI